MNLIVDLQYFPSVILYKNLDKFSNIIFEQYEHYQKMSFRNRCVIAGAAGLINLSIPLVRGRDQKTLLKDVRISDRNRWQDQHWKTIASCYSRSPWFEFYRDGLAGLYGKPFLFLRDWNLACFEWSLNMLRLPLQIGLTEAWQKSYDETGWMDWRGRILPKNVGHIGRSGDIPVPGMGEPLGVEKPIIYHQVFEDRTGFLPGLSILDLLFCEGNRSGALLKGA
jgi:WbqC-like protein family